MSLARCSRCECSYYKEEASPCRYHTGTYTWRWSCCKDMSHGAPGCRVGSHVEDIGYSMLLDSVCQPATQPMESLIIEGPNGTIQVAEVSLSPVTRRENAATQQPAVIAVIPDEGEASPRSQAETTQMETTDESAAAAGGSALRTVPVPYVVGPHDTWASICVRHRMTNEELLQLNGLRNRRARVGDVILVWAERSDEQQSEDWKRQLVRQFRRRTGCSNQEALYYLEQHDYVIGDAIRTRVHDNRWEAERALLVRNLANEEEMARQVRAEEEAARVEAARREAELRAAALARQARAAAHAEALRSLSACIHGGGRAVDGGTGGGRTPQSSGCLACLG